MKFAGRSAQAWSRPADTDGEAVTRTARPEGTAMRATVTTLVLTSAAVLVSAQAALAGNSWT